MSLIGEISEVVNRALEGGYPGIVATASADGTPHMAYRGSLFVLDVKRLAFWDRTYGTTLENIKQNPKIMVMVRDHQRKIGWRFLGRASITNDSKLRELVWSKVVQPEKDRDLGKTGVAVIVDVDYIVPLRGAHIPISRSENSNALKV